VPVPEGATVTSPRQSQGPPPFENAAQEVLQAAQGHQRRYAPPAIPLTAGEKAIAGSVTEAKCRQCGLVHRADLCCLCGCVHALPGTPSCPRLASFELDPEGRVRSGTLRLDARWMKGRVVPFGDLHEEEEEEPGADH
jgi:hypothetical protein